MLPSARIWTAAVSPRRIRLLKSGGMLDSDVGLPGQEQLLHPAGIGRPVGDPEDPARGEGVGQQPALPGLGLVDQRDADVLDIVVDHVAEDEKLDERRHHQDDAVLPVAEELDEFLADHFPDAKPAHSPSRFRMMTVQCRQDGEHPRQDRKIGPEMGESEVSQVDARPGCRCSRLPGRSR